VAVHTFIGVGVDVPKVRTWAVATASRYMAVAMLAGVGVGMTMIGVTQLSGTGV
jgi:hypothetical protein